MKRILVALALLVLAGCTSDSEDLRRFVRESDKRVPPKIEPLPAVKPFEPFTYEGFDLPDPFKPRKLSPPKQGGGLAPDLNRRREPLEAFPLEQLKMVGTLSQGKDTYALVRADKTLYRVKKGNYMGQNFGLITDVTENEIKLKEIVQDSAGDWAERQSVLPLLEEPAGKGDKK
ncbi:MAG TPA: pilus assembly protein PilP [Usitatibacter sp.]|jgi:type IV pilus assembly protein PilP|nr:pilus assembly protein PilP [Usitatibacter sp.]